VLGGTVAQVEVNQALVGDAFFLGHVLKVVHGVLVNTDGDLLLHPLGLRTLAHHHPARVGGALVLRKFCKFCWLPSSWP